MKEIPLKYLPILLMLFLALPACTPTATPVPSPLPTSTLPVQPTPTRTVVLPSVQPASGGITTDLLRNVTYKLDSSGGMQVTLTDGSFEVNDTANHLMASGQLVHSALGDLNGDGVTDAAVTIAANLGGSGTFHELIVVLSQDGQAVQAADKFLEDRLAEKRLSVADGLITLEMVRHSPSDPLCCPSENAVTVYRYDAGQITVVSDQVLPATGPAMPDIYPNQITIEAPQDGGSVGSNLLLRGQTSQMPFEKNLVVRVYDSDNRLVLELPLAVAGEYGGAGSFETNLQLPGGLKGAVQLDVVDIDMANGQPRGLASVKLNVQ
jgi:hypothetical protein